MLSVPEQSNSNLHDKSSTRCRFVRTTLIRSPFRVTFSCMSAHELSFQERYARLLGEAVLRLGTAGELSYYSRGRIDPDRDVYATVGLTVTLDPNTWRDTAPSLSDGSCSACGSRLAVTNVRESSEGLFAGTFATLDDSYTVVRGALVCAADASHMDDDLDESDRAVVLDGTLDELLPMLNELANELGY